MCVCHIEIFSNQHVFDASMDSFHSYAMVKQYEI